MKKILLVLSVLVSFVVVACSNSAATESSSNPAPVEDKSPFEYVKPACVDIENDYTYVGDYVFADTMNFADWKYSNATTGFTLPNGMTSTGYVLAFEKIARVRNDNPSTRLYRGNHLIDEPVDTTKATKYKIYVKTTVVNNTEINSAVINLRFASSWDDHYDGTHIKIIKSSDNTFIITDNGLLNGSIYSDVMRDYVAF